MSNFELTSLVGALTALATAIAGLVTVLKHVFSDVHETKPGS